MKRTQPKRVLKLARKRKEIIFSFGPGSRATKVRPVCCYFFCLLINYLAIFLQCEWPRFRSMLLCMKPALLLK